MSEHPGAGLAHERSSRPTLAACIITLNEEERLPRCLASVAFCDQIVVVDAGSQDRTVETARVAGALVIERPWSGFASQRNAALEAASTDWVLEIDADEWLGPAAQAEVERFLTEVQASVNLGMFPLREHFLGRRLVSHASYPYYRPRLLRRGVYTHDEDRTVHEGIVVRERPWVFEEELHHIRAATLGEALHDAIRYARLEARQLQSATGLALVTGVLLRPWFKLVYRAVVLGGWRDGRPGMTLLAIESAADAATWLLAAPRLTFGRSSAPASGAHFGRRQVRAGPIRIAVIGAPGPVACRQLESADRAGCWITLITANAKGPLGPRGDGERPRGWRIHRVRALSAFEVVRALAAEAELLPWDLIVVRNRLLRSLLRWLPPSARSGAPVVGVSTDWLTVALSLTRTPSPDTAPAGGDARVASKLIPMRSRSDTW